jgi:hypothetical protein
VLKLGVEVLKKIIETKKCHKFKKRVYEECVRIMSFHMRSINEIDSM